MKRRRCSGTVERGVVRPLGIATHAVHLLGLAPTAGTGCSSAPSTSPTTPACGTRWWAAWCRPTTPLAAALERETWEEAGLRRRSLQRPAPWRPVWSRAAPPGGSGRRATWWSASTGIAASCREGVVPHNQDGEVAQFALHGRRPRYAQRLERDEFTIDAACILAAAEPPPTAESTGSYSRLARAACSRACEAVTMASHDEAEAETHA